MIYKVILSLIISIVLAHRFYYVYQSDLGVKENEYQKHMEYIHGAILPLYILIFSLFCYFASGGAVTVKQLISICFNIFLHISLYYIVLTPLLPFLRKIISARACAVLWMLPNFLYIVFHYSIELAEPILVLHAPGNITMIAFYIWVAGFFAVLLWKIVEHLNFRHFILKDTTSLFSRPEITDILHNILDDFRMPNTKFRIVSSPNVTSPLTIGLFRQTMYIVFPERDYSSEEIELILRHEIIHIARGDSWSKFFLMFCTAMCWFNPLMWFAMKKSAEDLELSCDETVLLNANISKRNNYAALLLNITSDERGFTTCLSARAKTMQYRLTNIIQPKKRLAGSLFIGLIFFVLSFTSGFVALAYNDQSGAELIYNNDYDNYKIASVQEIYNYEIIDENAFQDYLSNLTFSEITGNYFINYLGPNFRCIINSPEGILVLTLHENTAEIYPLYESERGNTSYYYIRDGVDHYYLNQLIKQK